MTDVDDEFNRLEQELLNHSGEFVRRELEGINRSGTVLHSNYSVLIRHMNEFENNFKRMVAEDIDGEGTPNQNEFLRILHNYLASVNAIYDHTQRVRRKFDEEFNNDDFSNEYYRLLEEYEIGKMNDFLIDFRNYTQHYKLPLPTRRLMLDVTDRMTGEFDKKPQITFEVETLREGSFDWGHNSKEIMSDFEDGHIVLKEVVMDFHEELQSFHNDLYESASEMYEDELAGRDLIVYKMHKLKPDEVELPKEKVEWVEHYFDL